MATVDVQAKRDQEYRLAKARAKAAIQHARRDFVEYAERFLRIRPKSRDEDEDERSGNAGAGIIPLKLNRSQRYVHEVAERQLKERGYVRILVLKGRQTGISTYIEGRAYWKASGAIGWKGFILTHRDDATANLWAMTRRFHEHMDPRLKPHTRKESEKGLWFDRLDSRFGMATAGGKGVGRSDTLNFFHGCLGPDTLIVDGYSGALRRMDALDVGDVVRTHTGQIGRVSFISSQKKPARRVTFRGLRGFPLTATDEHRFWTPAGWRELGELGRGDTVGFPVPVITREIRQLPFRQAERKRPQGGGTRERIPKMIPVSYELGRVLGLYLAEGIVALQSASGEPASVSFAVHHDEVSRTERWLQPLSDFFVSTKTVYRKGCKTATVTVYGRSFACFMRDWCGRTDAKALPRGWTMMGEDFARGLVHGYLCGDGHFSPARDRRISATSIRAAITVGMRDALVALGYGWPCIDYKPAAVRHGRNEREAFVLRLCGPGVERLSEECGKPYVARKRTNRGRYGSIVVSDGYAWLPIVAMEDAGTQDVMDLEIDHPDHSYCTVHGATHNSEVAYWPNAADHAGGVLETIEDAGRDTEVWLETTGDGPNNWFAGQWRAAVAGKTDYEPVFVPWFWHDKYRRPTEGLALSQEDLEYQRLYELDDEQMAFRAHKIASWGGDSDAKLKFEREYPATPDEALQPADTANSVIPSLAVMRARRTTVDVTTQQHAPLVYGCDPSYMGGDRFVIYGRRGRWARRVAKWTKKDTVQSAMRCADIIRHDKPDAFIIEITGYGAGVYDQLLYMDLGKTQLIPYQGGEAADDPDQYANKRAECWGRARDWFMAPPYPDIDDDQEIHADLTATEKIPDAGKYRLKLETKEAMSKRDIPSPDNADALVVTFATYVTPASQRGGVDPDRPVAW